LGLRSKRERYVAEAVGTFILVAVSIGSAVVNVLLDGQLGLLGIACATGFAVLVVCYSLGHVSGAHINPAVTIAFASQKKFPLRLVPPYVVSQVAGAVAACLFVYTLFGNIANFGLIQPVYSWSLVFLVEFGISFVLMLVIMGVATDSRAADPSAAGLPIGAAVIMNTLLALGLTGAAMNPARAVAPAILQMDFSWQWVYWGATILGMIFGAWVYERIRTADAPKAEEFGLLGPIR
jgi:aquaporin NIP